MKNLQTTRKIEKGNRIVLPKDFCDKVGFYPGIRVRVGLDGNSIRLSLAVEHCHSCYTHNVKLIGYKGHFYCEQCASDLGWIAKKLQG